MSCKLFSVLLWQEKNIIREFATPFIRKQQKYHLMKKIKLDWKHTLFFFLLMGGIYYLTESFMMSLGIMLLLFVLDYFLQILDEKLKERSRKDE